jgi:hypothetical protein
MHRDEGKRWMRSRGLALLGLALLVGACSPTLDPLSERCLQALEYREPAHGDIETTESYPSSSGTTVAIWYVEEAASGTELPQVFTCEFEAGEPWSFTRIILLGREFSEAELALVNAEFLLRDLDRHPERLSGGRVARATSARLEVGAGPEHDDNASRFRVSRDLSWIESIPPLYRHR